MREFHRIIAEQANHMRGLIGDLLDTGRIESGTLSVAPEPSEVAGLVERARSTFLSGGGPHAVVVDLPAGPPPVMADRRRIVQVLNNLLANAARHAPASSPIRVSAVREETQVAVSVCDEAPAVAPERLPNLFRRHPGAGEGATAGHGLGLAIRKAAGPRAVRPAGHLHLGLPPRPHRGAGARGGRCRLHRQALLAHRAGLARVRAALRRRAEPEPFVLGDIAIEYGQRRVTVGGEAVDLTATEYELLRVLSLDAGRVVTFDTLLRRVWAKRENADANLAPPSSGTSAASWATVRPAPPTSSTSTASATAWRGRPTAEDAAVPASASPGFAAPAISPTVTTVRQTAPASMPAAVSRPCRRPGGA